MNNTTDHPWHSNALQHIAEQIATGRQPHATLFRLRNGYNDTELGWSIAKHLLADSPNMQPPCKHCHLVDERAHPNVLFLDVINEKVGIANVRELEQQMWKTSMFDKPKIAYIKGTDLLSLGAQNALLKTLEEPPKNTFFILSAQNISRILPTIMSRVQVLHHSKFTSIELLSWLQNQLTSPVSKEQLSNIAKLVDFSPLPALELITSPDSIKKLEKEKAQFVQFISGKHQTSTLETWLEKEQPQKQLNRFQRYTENMIRFLFEKTADSYNDLPNKRADNKGGDSVQYATWNGVSLSALYRLHDILLELQHLADTNVNLQLQFITSLTDWQHERRK